MPPAVIGVASIAVAVAGSAMSMYSQQKSAAYQAQVATNNQIIGQQNAKIALAQGQVEEGNRRLKTGAVVDAAEAQQAASGINPNSGSALNVRSSAAEMGELDALTIRYNSNMAARTDIQQSNNYAAAASLDQAQGQWGMTSSILGGASSVSDKWMKYQQAGVGGGSGGSNISGNPASAWSNNNFNVWAS
jgi:hypothetical protein